MATQGERRALLFLAAVALLGAGSRAWRSRSASVDTSALTTQIEAIDSAGRGGRTRKARKPVTRDPQPVTRIDLDTASAGQIEALPGIGPALAKRIIKDRESGGPFGCLAALDRVKGVGPALLARIDSLATFSGVGGVACVSPGPTRKE
jgi:competence ComEA-like helix-hairpin-helix protein